VQLAIKISGTGHVVKTHWRKDFQVITGHRTFITWTISYLFKWTWCWKDMWVVE